MDKKCKEMLASEKLRGLRHQKVCFLKLHMDVYLRAKFEVSSMILTSFRQGGGVVLICDCLDTLLIISNGYDGWLLRMRNHA